MDLKQQSLQLVIVCHHYLSKITVNTCFRWAERIHQEWEKEMVVWFLHLRGWASISGAVQQRHLPANSAIPSNLCKKHRKKVRENAASCSAHPSLPLTPLLAATLFSHPSGQQRPHADVSGGVDAAYGGGCSAHPGDFSASHLCSTAGIWLSFSLEFLEGLWNVSSLLVHSGRYLGCFVFGKLLINQRS